MVHVAQRIRDLEAELAEVRAQRDEARGWADKDAVNEIHIGPLRVVNSALRRQLETERLDLAAARTRIAMLECALGWTNLIRAGSMTMAKLDEIRNKSTAAKESLRFAKRYGTAGRMSDIRDHAARTEVAADKAVLEWIKQGCKP